MKKKPYEMKVKMIENIKGGQAIVDVLLPSNNPDTFFHLAHTFQIQDSNYQINTIDRLSVILYEQERNNPSAKAFVLKSWSISFRTGHSYYCPKIKLKPWASSKGKRREV